MFPIVTVVIIVINVVVSFAFEKGGWSAPSNDNAVVEYSFIPYELSHTDQECAQVGDKIGCGSNFPPVENGAKDVEQPSVFVTIFTAMFMHGSFLHIAGNVLFLCNCATKVEGSTG